MILTVEGATTPDMQKNIYKKERKKTKNKSFPNDVILSFYRALERARFQVGIE